MKNLRPLDGHIERHGDLVAKPLTGGSRLHPANLGLPGPALTVSSALVGSVVFGLLNRTEQLRALFRIQLPGPISYPAAVSALSLLLLFVAGRRCAARPGPSLPRVWILVLMGISSSLFAATLTGVDTPRLHAGVTAVGLSSLVLLGRLVPLSPHNALLAWISLLLGAASLGAGGGLGWLVKEQALTQALERQAAAVEALTELAAAVDALGEVEWDSYRSLQQGGDAREALEVGCARLDAALEGLQVLHPEHDDFKGALEAALYDAALLGDDSSAALLAAYGQAEQALERSYSGEFSASPRLSAFNSEVPHHAVREGRYEVNPDHAAVRALMQRYYAALSKATATLEPPELEGLPAQWAGIAQVRRRRQVDLEGRVSNAWLVGSLHPEAEAPDLEALLSLPLADRLGESGFGAGQLSSMLSLSQEEAQVLVSEDAGCALANYDSVKGQLYRVDCFGYQGEGAELAFELRLVYTTWPWGAKRPSEIWYYVQAPSTDPDFATLSNIGVGDRSLSALEHAAVKRFTESVALAFAEATEAEPGAWRRESLSRDVSLADGFRLVPTDPPEGWPRLTNGIEVVPHPSNPWWSGQRVGVVLRAYLQ
jgi:hypothetical protein